MNQILIVEDDPAISKLINTNLALSGYQTVCTMDGRQAVEAIHAQRFDLALCDIMLPELDGFELLRLVEPQPPEKMLDIEGMRDEMRRPMMLIVAARKKSGGR